MTGRKENRAHPRLEAYHLAKYRLISEPAQGQKVMASIKNISGGGVCLSVNEDLPIQALMELDILFLGMEEPITCKVKIVWKKYLKSVKKYLLGTQFIEIDEDLRAQIIQRTVSVLKGAEKTK